MCRKLARRAILAGFALLVTFHSHAFAQPKEFRRDEISGGAEASARAERARDIHALRTSPNGPPDIAGIVPGVSFLGYNFDDNVTLTGFMTIPPDPCGAAGIDRVLAVVNVGIECRDKTGILLFRDSLQNFFAPVPGNLGTLTFDPKVVYDHYEQRFVVVTLERWFTSQGYPSNESRILVAVSKTSTPGTATAADWWYFAIDSKMNIGGIDHWADYPGFEVDGEAVYITANMYPFSGSGSYTRLWIVDKGLFGGFYAGGPAAWAVYDPIPAGYYHMTMMPALVYGGGPGNGTFLVGYSSLTAGGPGGHEFVQLVRVTNPLVTPTFAGVFVDVGDIENVGGAYGFPAIPDAPQNGGAALIEVNDSRALDAVWRGGSLWMTTTINPGPGYDLGSAGQATAHWFRLDTFTLGLLLDQGNIGGEDIASATSTFMPSVAVNADECVMFGFAASASTIYCGAYMAGREATDPPGTVQLAGVVQAGLDYYLRTFGAGRNRWGDYSGAAVDPADDKTFWIFNEYAEWRGTGLPPEDGRWGTAWASASCVPGVMDFGDAPDPSYPTLLASNGARHALVPGVYMGLMVDPEADGQPDPMALGDDLAMTDDEDGVNFVTPLVAGQPAQVDVVVSQNGWLDAWIDYNQNGSWLDPGELVYSGAVVAPNHSVLFVVPPAALTGTTFARFRYNLNSALPPSGPAGDGEVEDYQVSIQEVPSNEDFGDAPDSPGGFHTLLASNGARHVIVPGIYMGASIDGEADGQPTVPATGDDTFGIDDEDGVTSLPLQTASAYNTATVTVSANGYLDAWYDFNSDFDWNDPGEHVYSGLVLAGGYGFPFYVPLVNAGAVHARFRYSTTGPLPVDGPAPDGEVEDYLFPVIPLDLGDAPDPVYQTLTLNTGARHVVTSGVYMGASVDAEYDGQPDANAQGDDAAGVDDEDGVTFTTALDPTQTASVDVTASVNGYVDAWIDFNSDGVWSATEKVVSATAVAGVNSYSFVVPSTSAGAFVTFARFRFNTGGNLAGSIGWANDGEVEDYEVLVLEDIVTDVKDAVPTAYALHDAVPNPFNPSTTISFALPEGRHVQLTVYDVRGHRVATLVDGRREAGTHQATWNGRDHRGQPVASGVYLYRIQAGSFTETKRMVLIK